MKKLKSIGFFLRFRIVICFSLLFSFYTSYSQKELPYVVGEHLTFDISFVGFKVGDAELKIVDLKEINSISTYHIIGSGRTSPFFDLFFKVRDMYETYLDTSSVLPVKFVRDIYEGGFTKQQTYNFYHLDSIVYSQNLQYKISKTSQDMLSALYFARTFNKQNLKFNDSFFVPIFMDEENYLLEITYIENQMLETQWGTINCMVFKPKMQKGRVFEDGEKMKIWITDDPNHLLMKVETQIWAGKIIAILSDYDKIKVPMKIELKN